MHISGFDGILWLLGIVGEVLLLSVIVWRRLYRAFPLFTAFIVWAAVSDPLLFATLLIRHDAYDPLYYRTYFTVNILQYCLEIGVLMEIATNVLGRVRQSLSRQLLLAFFVCMGLIAVGAFVLAAHFNAATLAHARAFVVMDMSVDILRLVTFALIAAFSQVLGITWRNHVLQLASGLAFYAAISLVVGIAHSNLRAGPEYAVKYREFAQLGVLGYLCALYYWCFVFARQEAPRKEFNSKMSDFLVSISGMPRQQQSIVARKNR